MQFAGRRAHDHLRRRLGALFRAQVLTVAGVVVWALFVENIITVLKPRVGIYLPFAAFQQLTLGGPCDGGDAEGCRRSPGRSAFLVASPTSPSCSVAAVFISLRRDVT